MGCSLFFVLLTINPLTFDGDFGFLSWGKGSGFHDASLENCQKLAAVFQDGDVRNPITVHHEHIDELSNFQSSKLVTTAHDFRSGFGGTHDGLQRSELICRIQSDGAVTRGNGGNLVRITKMDHCVRLSRGLDCGIFWNMLDVQ